MASSSDLRVLDAFHPLVRSWFLDRFAGPTPAQVDGWPHIHAGRDVLIAAPTGSGKTLAAFLASLDRLIRAGEDSTLKDQVDVLYISPLKALSNDIQRNLDEPLRELRERACADGVFLPEIRTALRTGDTKPSERAKILRKPPHILITTPESLYIMLTAEKSRALLSSVRTVIVDEIHAIAGDKRGSHMSLTLARLDDVVRRNTGSAPARIGLSATQRPIDTIGRLLVGNEREMPVILDRGHARKLDIQIEATDDELGAVASNEQFGRVYDRIAALCLEHETTLVFVNTRRLVERVSHALEKRLGEDQVVAHHGSLSKRLRFAAEQRLKTGEVRCAVATASLELGIDVGSVDLVVQLGSPRSIATLLQRIGRSGHSIGKTPKGRLFAMTRDQLAESAALVRAIKSENLDCIEVPEAPLDVLSQQIVAEVACGERGEDELFALMRTAMPYANLRRVDFDRVLEILSEGISTTRGRSRAHLHRDRINGVLKPRRGARLAALTNAGTIPDNFNYRVLTFPEETPVGTLDEDFAIESNAGDIFLLGNTSWQIHRLEAGKVYVRDAHGAPPSVPFWVGEAPARTRELSSELASLRVDIEKQIEEGASLAEITSWLSVECNLPESFAGQLVAYYKAGHSALGALPTEKCIIAERFFDSAGGMQLILHSPFGARINKAWGLALRKRFCRSFNLELQAAATDDGLLLSLGPVHSFELETVFDYLRSASVRNVLRQAVLGAPVFGIRWRWCATRSLAVLRRNAGKAVAPQILRMRTEDMLSTVFPMQQACLENVVGDIEIPEHPLVDETMRDCLEEFMDIAGLENVLKGIESGDIRVLARETSEPSPLCHELVNANPYAYLDDAPLEERRTRAVSLPRGIDVGMGDLTKIDANAVADAEGSAAPTIRDADELHDALMSLYLLPVDAILETYAAQLIARGRATRFTSPGQGAGPPSIFWVAAERLASVEAAIVGGKSDPEMPELPFELEVPEGDKASVSILRGHLEHLGPKSISQLQIITSLGVEQIAAALAVLESQGVVLRGSYTKSANADDISEWCDKRMLARIQRLTVQKLRKQVEPVTAAILNRFLFRWQRVGQDAKLIGADGLRQIVEQVQGFECAAGAWESEILPARLHSYNPDWLDALCLSGQVSWARLSPKQGLRIDSALASTPSKTAPLTLMLRDDMAWLRAAAEAKEDESLSPAALRIRDTLAERGASFLRDLVVASELPAPTIEDALWELVGLGLATADGFTSLRLLINRHKGETKSLFDGKGASKKIDSSRWRKALKKSRKRDSSRSAHSHLSIAAAAGRWSLLPVATPEDLDLMGHARQLLNRYGIIFRDLLVRESALPPWRDLLQCLRRLEARGEIRGGRFVNGFVGEQFALPEAVSALRALRRNQPIQAPEIVTLAGTDPLNLVGITSAGNKVPAVLGNKVLYRDGTPIATLEAGKVVMRETLENEAFVDSELCYHAPPRSPMRQQKLLPLD
jgi:ATP-dependent Lhr-like helicase